MDLESLKIAAITGTTFAAVFLWALKEFLTGFFKKAGEDAYAALKKRWQWVWLAVVWGVANAIPAYFALAAHHSEPVSGRELSSVVIGLWLAGGLALLCLLILLFRIIRLLTDSHSALASTVEKLVDTQGRMIGTQGRLVTAVGKLADPEDGEKSGE